MGKAGAQGKELEQPAGLTLSEAVARSTLSPVETPRPAPVVLAVVDQARCDGCGSCAAVCPTEAIAVEAVARVEPASCIACGQCVVSCPRKAIVLETLSRAAARRGSP